MFRKDQNLIDTLLPELTGEEAPAVFGHNKWVPVHKALRYMVLREFTTGVRAPTAWSRWAWHGSTTRASPTESKGLRDWAETLGISPEEAVEAVSLLLDNWRRSRFFYVTGDPIFSRYPRQGRPVHPGGAAALAGVPPRGPAA